MTESPKTSDRKPKHFGPGFFATLVLVVLAAAAIAWHEGILQPQPTIALVTNNSDPFWDPVIRGAQDAASKYSVHVKIVKGDGSAEHQSNVVRQLMNEGVRGLGISPIDANEQAPVLREVAVRMPLVTFDSDCPDSSRLWFVGTDNYAAGRQCGTIVHSALPDGGEVLISMGSATAENAILRRQGVIDELLERDSWGKQRDPIEGVLQGSKYTIVATSVDNHDKGRATQLTIDQIKAHPNLKCIVALYSYSAPAVLDALQQTGRLGQIKVIGFDVLPETLDALEAGNVVATMQQAQYDFGVDTVRAIVTAMRGGLGGMGSSPLRYTNVRPILRDDVAKVRQELGQSSAAAAGGK